MTTAGAELPASALSQDASSARSADGPSLRVWPALAIIVLQWVGYILPGKLLPGTFEQFMGMLWSPVVATLLLSVWWIFFARLRGLNRLVAPLALILTGVAESFLYHPSIGAMGMIFSALPVVNTAWVLWIAATSRLNWSARRAGLVAIQALAWGYFALTRFDGLDGSFNSEVSYRWMPTKEDQFLAARAKSGAPEKEPTAAAPAAKALELQKDDWPGFRGSARVARLTGLRTDPDWKAHPPKELWRKRVGPGWGAFCAVDNYVYTQEQWDKDEAVVCYAADTGVQAWAHRDAARFTEIVAGPGPRATPTFSNGKIFAFGATGKLNCLDALTGAVVWSKDAAADAHADAPMWGFSSSPLVAKGLVVVFAGGKDDKSVLAYEEASGKLRWSGGKGALSYCSPQLDKLAGVEQVTIATDEALFGFEPESGKELWQFPWPSKGVARVVQPAAVGDADLLLGTGFGMGTKRVHLAKENGTFSAKEVWHSRAFSPYFNDFVIHKDCVYGFNGTFLSCVGVEDGKEKWHVQGYGNGQVLLITDQNLLLVMAEKGFVALVEASPAGPKEISQFKAIEGKTWNHPVVAHGRLFVRNGEEAACFQLAVDPAGAP